MVTYITNISVFLSMAIIVNSFLLISSTFWVVGKAYTIEYLIYSSFIFVNRLFILEKVRKSIFKTTSMLVLSNKKVFLKS